MGVLIEAGIKKGMGRLGCNDYGRLWVGGGVGWVIVVGGVSGNYD